jgi:flavin-dependent dehydrogenase
MAEKKWDAIVIGAGPAGASAARTLVAGGMSCLVVEKKKLPRHKMCSGILSDWAVDFIHRKFGPMPEEIYCRPSFLNGVALHFPSLADPVVVPSVHAIPNVWRSHLDWFLTTSSGAKIRDELALQGIESRTRGGFKIACRPAGKSGRSRSVSLNARYVIAADGGNSPSIRRLMPEAFRDLPFGTGMQLHYRGKVDLDPRHYNMFFHQNIGFYAWANIKDDDIHVGVGAMGNRKLPPYHANFVSLLTERYGFEIHETLMREGMTGVMQAPVNRFTLGRGNFLAAGDAAGFIHNGGEGISCALSTGDLAAEAVLQAEKTGQPALDIYRRIVRGEADLCLDQTNPLRMMQASPMRMDMKAVWKRHSLKEIRAMWKDLKAFGSQDNGFSDMGIGPIAKRNMIHRLRHGRYPIDL